METLGDNVRFVEERKRGRGEREGCKGGLEGEKKKEVGG